MDDYYTLLGIESNADDTAVRRAWRRLALRWHPDRAGPSATAKFQEIAAAYAVLSDPATRAAYDRRRGTTAAGSGQRPERDRVASSPPATTRRRAPAVMLSRVSGSLNGLLACGIARRAGGEVIELLLDDEEAAQGGMVTISMRVPVRCQACASAADTTVACARCGGKRTFDELFSAWLAVPPGVEDGTDLAPSAQLPGVIRAVHFRARCAVPWRAMNLTPDPRE